MTNSSRHIALPSHLTIRNAQEVAALLCTEAGDEGVTIAGDAVEEITSPGLQLLAAQWQYAKHHERAFHIHKPSAALKDALCCAGLSYLLD